MQELSDVVTNGALSVEGVSLVLCVHYDRDASDALAERYCCHNRAGALADVVVANRVLFRQYDSRIADIADFKHALLNQFHIFAMTRECTIAADQHDRLAEVVISTAVGEIDRHADA